MHRVIKQAIIVILYILILVENIFSYSQSRVSYDKFSSYISVNDEMYFYDIVELSNMNIRCTQDDNNFKFFITGNATAEISKKLGNRNNYMSGTFSPILYKVENFTRKRFGIQEIWQDPTEAVSGTYPTKNRVFYNNMDISFYEKSITYNHAHEITKREISKANSGGRYFIPPSLRPYESRRKNKFTNEEYPYFCEGNGEGVTLIRNATSESYIFLDTGGNVNGVFRNYINAYNARIDIAISIRKNLIDDYRYLAFGRTMVTQSVTRDQSNMYKATGECICSGTIDLKNYCECEHEWVYTGVADRNTHTIKCRGCEWEKKEEHKFIYAYDSCKNNVCDCSIINKVKCEFIIEDDYTSSVSLYSEPASLITPYKFKEKKGYNFKWYEKHEKKLKNVEMKSLVEDIDLADESTFIGNVNDIPDIVSTYSTIYKAVYEPIKYRIAYSNINNKSLEFNEVIADQLITYDEKFVFKNNIDEDGYIFKGWTTKELGEEVIYEPLDEQCNLSSVDESTITVYPIYDEIEFSIHYKTDKGRYENGRAEISKNYSYTDSEKLIFPTYNSTSEYFSYYVDENGNKYNNLNEIKNNKKRSSKNHEIVTLKAVFSKSEYGSPERTATTVRAIDVINTETRVIESETVDILETHTAERKKTPKIVEEEIEAIDENDENDEDSHRASASILIKEEMDDGQEEGTSYDNITLLELFKYNKLMFFFILVVLITVILLYEYVLFSLYKQKILKQV